MKLDFGYIDTDARTQKGAADARGFFGLPKLPFSGIEPHDIGFLRCVPKPECRNSGILIGKILFSCPLPLALLLVAFVVVAHAVEHVHANGEARRKKCEHGTLQPQQPEPAGTRRALRAVVGWGVFARVLTSDE